MASRSLGRRVGLCAWLLIALVAAVAVAPGDTSEYRIGSGDVVRITVWGHEDLSKDYQVDEAGFVLFPLLGRVEARGATVGALAALLTERLGKDYLVDPQVFVTVKEYQSQRVQVLGEAQKPGLFYLTGRTTLVEVLSRAGGLTSYAGREVLIVRGGGEATPPRAVLRANLEKLQAGDTSEDLRLENGDIVIVPRAQSAFFFVLGEVRSAGAFTLTNRMTVLDAVTMAGGFSDRASTSAVRLIRRSADGRQETRVVNLSDAGSADGTVALQDGDTVMVPRAGVFFVLGETRSTGAFPLQTNTTLLDAVSIAGGFSDRAAASEIKVIRRNGTGKQDTVVVNLSDANSPDAALALQDGDTVLVPRRGIPAFFVFGEVKSPGSFQLQGPVNVLEAIILAGGFTERAAPGRTRIIRNGPSGQETISVDVNDIIKRGQREKALLLKENDVVMVPESFF